MPAEKDWALWTYSDERDGQIAAGTVTSPWFSLAGISKILIQGVFATGTTQILVDFSGDGVTVDHTSADQFANIGTGAELNSAYDYARVRIVQSVATTTNAELSVKGSD